MSGHALLVATSEAVASGKKALPRMASARPLDARRARIEWLDGRQVDVDLSPAFVNLRVFRQLRGDDSLFATMKLDEFGDALVWEDGAELSAEWVEELAQASMTNVEFREAMDRLSATLDSMAALLGIARRLIADYRKDKPIPKTVALATRHLVGMLWTDSE